MSWESDWKKIESKINHVLNSGIRATIFEISAAIIKDTPVDTGRARGNWQASIGSGEAGTIDRFGQSEAIADVSNAASIAVGKVYFLTNNVEYIERLEFGWSKQSPSGMVRKNLQNFDRLLAKNIKAANN